MVTSGPPATLAALAAACLAWWLGGLLATWLELGVIDLLLRGGLVLLALHLGAEMLDHR